MDVRSVCEDSRRVERGALFVARRGTRADGRAFIGEAVERGAVAVLTDDPGVRVPEGVALVVCRDVAGTSARIAERLWGNPASRLRLIGVTGTNGKTTTAHLVQQILNGAGRRCGLIGTVCVDDGAGVRASDLTTPSAFELSRTFATMVERGCEAAVMEVSSHALDQGRVAGLAFDVGVFTNLSGDHLDYHGTPEAYAAAKARLFAMLPRSGFAVVNAEDPAAARMVEQCEASVVRCGIGGRFPCRAEVASSSVKGSSCLFTGAWGEFACELSLVGRHNVMNALQACAAAYAVGARPEHLKQAMDRAKAPPGRLEPVGPASGEADGISVFVDYAHTDDALEKALSALRPIVPAGGRLWVVFGCGGDRDRTKRPRMGRVASRLADAVVVTSDNPRTEDPERIVDEIMAGVEGVGGVGVGVGAGEGAGVGVGVGVEVHRIVRRDRAIGLAIDRARAGDVVLIAGKGHEDYQIVSDGKGGTVKRPFDDREVARRALSRRLQRA